MKIKCLQIFLLETALFAYALMIPTSSEGSAMGEIMADGDFNGGGAISQTHTTFENYTPGQIAATVFGVLGAEFAPAMAVVGGAAGTAMGAGRLADAFGGVVAGVRPAGAVGTAILNNAAAVGSAIGAAPGAITAGATLGGALSTDVPGTKVGGNLGTETTSPSAAVPAAPSSSLPSPPSESESKPTFTVNNGPGPTFSDGGRIATYGGETYHLVKSVHF